MKVYADKCPDSTPLPEMVKTYVIEIPESTYPLHFKAEYDKKMSKVMALKRKYDLPYKRFWALACQQLEKMVDKMTANLEAVERDAERAEKKKKK